MVMKLEETLKNIGYKKEREHYMNQNCRTYVRGGVFTPAERVVVHRYLDSDGEFFVAYFKRSAFIASLRELMECIFPVFYGIPYYQKQIEIIEKHSGMFDGKSDTPLPLDEGSLEINNILGIDDYRTR